MSETKTGYPHIDKPWMKYYDDELLHSAQVKRTVWEEVYANNADNLEGVALEFFGAKIPFRKLFQNIDICAASLCGMGIKKGDVVTIISAGIPEVVYLFYALSKIGGIANFMAPHFDKDGMRARINDCGSRLAFVMDEFWTEEVKETLGVSCVKQVVLMLVLASSPLGFLYYLRLRKHLTDKVMSWKSFTAYTKQSTGINSVEYEPNLPFVIVYSSGTTGASKGILLSQDSFQNSVYAYGLAGIGVSRSEKMYQIIPPWFSTGISTCIHLPLSKGATVFMDPRFDRAVFVKNIFKAKPTYAIGATSLYEGFLTERIPSHRSLDHFVAPFEGGEALLPSTGALIDAALKKYGCPTGLRVGYGQCECGAAVCTMLPDKEHPAGSVGVPLPTVVVKIVDEQMRKLPCNTRGNIVVDTPCGMLGYYKNECATGEYFFLDDEVRWSKTGDVGYLDPAGNLFVEGRESDKTLVGEKMVYNFDIENALMRSEWIKMVDVLKGKIPGDSEGLVVHIVLAESAQNLDEGEVARLFQQAAEKAAQEVDIDRSSLKYFKVWDIFPQAKSGKRDVEHMRTEIEGIVSRL